MMALRCSSEVGSVRELVALADGLGNSLFLSPKAAASKTKKELEASFALARAAFKEGANLSEKTQNEALLFLACETNFSSAARKIGAAGADDFVLVLERKVPVAKLRKTLRLSSANALALSEWGKKKDGYFEAELAIERMTLARIKN